MSLNNYDYEKILHDLKRIGKGIEIIQGEEIKEKRNLVAELLMAELDRLYNDIEEMREKK